MLRIFGIAAIAVVAICLAIGASIALADDIAPTETQPSRAIEAIDPDRRMIDESLAMVEDIYEFDFTVATDGEMNPEFEQPTDIMEI